MNKICNWDNFRNGIERVPRKSNDWTTNLFAQREQIETWIATGAFFYMHFDDATIFLKSSHDFYYIYHVASNSEKLSAALKGLPANRKFVADLIDHEKNINRKCIAYENSNFSKYKKLIRMTHSQKDFKPLNLRNVEVATLPILPEVKSLLDRRLDIYSEHPPSAADLNKYAENRQILVSRADGVLGGVLIFEHKGLSAHLRYWHVDHHLRGIGIGRSLLSFFFATCADVQKICLWVFSDNWPSIEIYNHYGFVADGLVDQIMIRRERCEL